MKVWFKLVIEGQLEDSPDKIKLNEEEDMDVADLKDAVKLKCSPVLDGVATKDLTVYENETSWSSGNALKVDAKLRNEFGLGQDINTAVIVVVPPSIRTLSEASQKKNLKHKSLSSETSCRKYRFQAEIQVKQLNRCNH